MQLIDRLTDAAIQQSILTGNPGQRITLTVRFCASQQLWFADIVWNDFSVYGIGLVNGVNILRNYRNLIPFGMWCDTTDGQDPYTLDAFSTGYAKLYLLSADEVTAIEERLFT